MIHYQLIKHATRKRVLKYLFFIPYLQLIYCFPPVKVVKGPGYLPENIEQRTLIVVPFIDSVDIKYDGDVSDELGPGTKKEAILSFIYNQLRFGLRDSSLFRNVKHDSFQVEPEFIPEPVSDTDTFPVVKNNNKLALKNNGGDIVLYISDFHLSDRLLIGRIPGTFIPAPQNRSMHIKCKFVFWDNRKLQSIYFGKIDVDFVPSSAIFTYNEWDETVKALAGMLLRKTRFKRINYY